VTHRISKQILHCKRNLFRDYRNCQRNFRDLVHAGVEDGQRPAAESAECQNTPSPIAGVCNGQVWNAPSIPRKMPEASSTCLFQTDTMPWPQRGLGAVGEWKHLVGRAPCRVTALRLLAFFITQSRKGAKKCQPNPSFSKTISGMMHLSP
jgi:hypothetical protein